MDKHQLAQELRQRQYNLGIVERWMIDSLSDDDIIDSYITCSDCGRKQVTGQKLDTAIHSANDAYQFFQLCDDFAEEQYKESHAGVQKDSRLKARNPHRRKSLPTRQRRI